MTIRTRLFPTPESGDLIQRHRCRHSMFSLFLYQCHTRIVLEFLNIVFSTQKALKPWVRTLSRHKLVLELFLEISSQSLVSRYVVLLSHIIWLLCIGIVVHELVRTWSHCLKFIHSQHLTSCPCCRYLTESAWAKCLELVYKLRFLTSYTKMAVLPGKCWRLDIKT